MRQKVDNYKKEIRRKNIDQYFLQKRKDVANHLQDQQRTFSINEQVFDQQSHKSYLTQQNAELQAVSQRQRQTEIDVFQIWKMDLINLENYLSIGQYEKIVLIMNEVYYTLKKVINPNGSLYSKQSEIYKYFLRTGLLASMIKGILLAHKDKVSLGLFQNLSKRMIDILKIVIQYQPEQFSESIFIQSNLLLLLRLCIDEPKLDKRHLSKILNIIVHMINVSDNETGKLFDLLNSNDGTFNFGAPFYNISKIIINPTEQITIQFIIMMKFYLLRIQDVRKILKNKKGSINQIKVNLTPYQLDLSAQIAINSFQHFVNQDVRFLTNQKDDFVNFEQSLEVIRLLIQLQIMSTRFVDRIDYRKMIDLLSLSNIPSQIKITVLSLIDHLIYTDDKDKYSFVFINNCDLLSTLWTIRNVYSGYVMNIFINIAYSRQFKSDLNPYVHNIFIILKYQTNNILTYNFIYNWFCSQDFEILESRDKLILHLLSESTQTDERITDMESLLWLRFVQKGHCNVPLRILQLDNDSVRYIKELIKIDSAL